MFISGASNLAIGIASSGAKAPYHNATVLAVVKIQSGCFFVTTPHDKSYVLLFIQVAAGHTSLSNITRMRLAAASRTLLLGQPKDS
jgi:hypothetical protein